MMSLCIVIPAYNEQFRIEKTLAAYVAYFDARLSPDFSYELLVVLNGCVDNTLAVVQTLQTHCSSIKIIDHKQAGKGLALIAGFKKALEDGATHIGFVDADMATQPQYFDDLLANVHGCDGVIASRYMKGAEVYPPRPPLKRWGSRLVYEPLITALFGMRHYDYQCGAKVFKKEVIEKVVPYLTITQWAFDVELLYLCKKYGFVIKEVPTVWYDQADSKLKIARAGWRMISALFRIRARH